MSGIDDLPDNERLGVPAHLLQGRPGDHYVLRVVGDSMREEGVLDGDYVICVREEPRPGDLAVCAVRQVGEDAVTVKRWYPEGDTVRLVPCDQGLEPLRFPVKDVSVTGVVVGLMRRFKRGEVAP